MKLDAKTIVLFCSLLLNALGGSGIIPPAGAPAPSPCAPAPVSTDDAGVGGAAQ